MSERVPGVLAPDEMALLGWLRERLDASMLDELAANDYGADVAAHRRAIDALLRAQRLPDELGWHPREVLSLGRWAEPTDRRGHLMRMLCCLLLTRVPSRDDVDPADSLAPLVDSVLAVEPSAIGPARRYLAWCRVEEPGEWREAVESLPFLTFALLVLCLAEPLPDQPGLPQRLVGLLLDELASARGDPGASWRVHADPPLLGLRRRERRHVWRRLARQWLIDPPHPYPDPDVAHRLASLGRALCGEASGSVDQLRALFGG